MVETPEAADLAAADLDRYRLIKKVGECSGSSLWYARLREAEADGTLLTAGITSRHEFERAARHRASTERLITIHPRPGGKAAAFENAPTVWASEVNTHRSSMRHPHILHTYEASASDPILPFLVLEFPEGGCLDKVLRSRRRLEPEECAGVVAHVGRALSWLHSQGLVHGGVDASNIFLTRGAASVVMPPWPDPWSGRGGAPGVEGTPADDVLRFAELTWTMLTGRSPGPWEHRIPLPMSCPSATKNVVQVLEAALDPHSSARPDAQELALVVRGAWDAVPIDLHSTADADFASRLPARPDPSKGRFARRGGVQVRKPDVAPTASRGRAQVAVRFRALSNVRRLAALAHPARRRWKATVMGLLLVAAVVHAASRPLLTSDKAPPTSDVQEVSPIFAASTVNGGVPTDTPEPTGAAEAVEHLVAARDRALRERDPSLIGAYAAADSEVEKADGACIDALRSRSVVWGDLRTRVEDIVVEEENDSLARVRAKLFVSGWKKTTPNTQEADDTIQSIRLHLDRATGSWRIKAVEAVPD
ncbi:MAG: protein kinase [Kocuria sp.]|nr:protein kinase [Kocuria sp.]MDN5617464.1 protein kinase [Kocuria sp.]